LQSASEARRDKASPRRETFWLSFFARRGLSVNAYNAYQSIIRGGHTFLTIRTSDVPVTNQGDKIDILSRSTRTP